MRSNYFTLSLIVALLTNISLIAQENGPHQLDINTIKSMCGCFEVTFNFAEIYSDSKSYEFRDRYSAKANAEWAVLVGEDDQRLQIQHILVVGDDITVKHWRQDWVYESPYQYVYDRDQQWTYKYLPLDDREGRWTQQVYQVDDSPRYQGTSEWMYQDGRISWESSTDTPLPRRESTQRSDYNVMHRRNRHMITNSGWVHEQDNEKILRTEITDTTIVYEKGVNIYRRIEDANCQAAIDWWDANEDFWQIVRDEWDAVYNENLDIGVHLKLEGKSLIKTMYTLNNEWTQQKSPSKKKWKKKIKSIIKSYVYHPN